MQCFEKSQHVDLLHCCNEDMQGSSTSYTDVPLLVDLERLKDWQKSLGGVPLVMEESIVKEFLIGAGYNQQAVRKYKTLRAWEQSSREFTQ